MALYNTYADAANTAVRAFLTEIGEYYWGKSFNTSSGKAKKDWETIRDQIFSGECAYCGKSDSKLQMEHLIMFNRTEFGLHHPGNIVPSCKECNSRSKKWTEHIIPGKSIFHLYVRRMIKKKNFTIDGTK